MPETMPVDQPVRVVALPAEQAAGFRAAARAAVERDPAALAGTGAEVRIAVPAEGQHQAVSVEPGQTVVLEGEAFRSAVYVMQPEGLVVLVEGGTLLLPDVAPATPIVIDGLQPILAAEMAAAPAVQPEAGQAAAHGGGAGFAAAEAASMGSGLDAMGPLAATALGHAAAFGEPPAGSARTLRGSLSSDDDGTDGNPGGGSDDDDDDGTDHGGPGDDDDDTDHGGGGDDDDGPGPIANARPLAGDDRVATDEGRSLTISAADLLRNDGDADGNPLRITAVDGGRFGEAVLNPDGSITFTPRGDFHGEASFRYTVSDGQGGSDRATVRVEVRPVNDAPVAADDALRTDEDRVLRIEASTLLRNDRDIDGDALRIVGVGDASHGTVTLAEDGGITFAPDADFHGQASFTYTVSDGRGGFDTAVARIEVAPVNDEPIAT
ncbi:MAG TPA: cadherin-like domain-containing protein, partial [Geminicoccus sp.]|nr:cadherin-like domain-containing protein [Geminicoccus sp.]